MIGSPVQYLEQTQSIGFGMYSDYHSALVPIPPDFVIGIAFEDRVTTILPDDRETIIPFEDRVPVISSEDRTITIPFSERTICIPKRG